MRWAFSLISCRVWIEGSHLSLVLSKTGGRRRQHLKALSSQRQLRASNRQHWHQPDIQLTYSLNHQVFERSCIGGRGPCWPVLQDGAIVRKTFETRQLFWDIDPRQAFIIERVAGWYQHMRIVKSADVNFDDRSDVAAVALPSQRCAAFVTKGPAHVWGRRINMPLFSAEDHLIGLKANQCPNPGTTVPTTALTVTVSDDEGGSISCISYCSAHAATVHCPTLIH